MPGLVLGETRTCLLRNSGAVASHTVRQLLELLPGERVRTARRPIEYAVSPEVVTGVDCPLPTASGARYRGVGTVAVRGVVTGGRVLQGSAYTRVERSGADHRLSWGHYLARPGVLEAIGRIEPDDVAKGHLAGPPGSAARQRVLDLGAVDEWLIGRLQRSPVLDRTAPFRSRRTRLRWVAVVDEDLARPSAELTLVDDVVRTLLVWTPDGDIEAVIGLCEDVAVHDWILTTLLQIVERGRLDAAIGPETIERLRPAVDHLLHLWMPGAHVSDDLLPLWDGLERRPGFTRQWHTAVTRIRDQLSLYTLTALGNSGLNVKVKP